MNKPRQRMSAYVIINACRLGQPVYKFTCRLNVEETYQRLGGCNGPAGRACCLDVMN